MSLLLVWFGMFQIFGQVRLYVSKVGILFSSIFMYYKDYVERFKVGLLELDGSVENFDEEFLLVCIDVEKEESVWRLKLYFCSQICIEEVVKLQSMIFVILKKIKFVCWQFGI